MKKKKKDSKGKGDRGERAVAKLFQAWWGSDFARTPQSGGFSTKKFRDEWNAAADLVTPDESFPFAVESKNAEGWIFDQLLSAGKSDLFKWWQQTVEQCPEDQIPLLAFTRNYSPYYVMIPASLWRDYIRWTNSSVAFRSPVLYFHNQEVDVAILLWSAFSKTDPEEWKKYGKHYG